MLSMFVVRRRALPWLLGCCLLAGTGEVSAQKSPGQTVPDAAPLPIVPLPVAPSRTPRVAPYRAPSFAPPPPLGGAERDPQAQALAAQLPLDPATSNLQGRLPTDVSGTIRRLGLRVPNGERVDLRGGQVTPAEVIDALRH